MSDQADQAQQADREGGGRLRSRAVLVAGAAVLAAVLAAVVVGTVVALGDGSGDGRNAAGLGTTSSRPGPTTTTTLPAATSDPAAPPYQGVPLPRGVNATIDTCTWSPAAGGELQASGAIASEPGNDDFWVIEVFWLQNDRELDSQADLFEVPPGRTTAWRLTVEAPVPPADLRCALEVS
jgi:hypothetical protein